MVRQPASLAAAFRDTAFLTGKKPHLRPSVLQMRTLNVILAFEAVVAVAMILLPQTGRSVLQQMTAAAARWAKRKP